MIRYGNTFETDKIGLEPLTVWMLGRNLLLQFLIESTSLCILGGLIGLTVAYAMCFGIATAFPSFPVQFSFGLVLIGMFVSIFTGLISGFAPAWSASRLDPVTALRYE